jgi:hypothetical protein
MVNSLVGGFAGGVELSAPVRVFTLGSATRDVRIGAADPAEAIDQEVAAHPGYAGFVISTLPAEKSRWLRMDLPRTVRAKHELPVHHVVAEAPPDVGPWL